MRREKIITIEEEGRDKGKQYLLTEMPAAKAEKWAMRALNALLASGIAVPDNVARMGLAGVAATGLQSFSGLPWEQVEPLLDEMMSCVRYVYDPKLPDGRGTRALMEDAGDIEDVLTRFTLRREVLELHLGFSLAEKLSTSEPSEKPSQGSRSTRISRD